MKIRVKIGDIFQIPITETLFCFGQVIENRKGALRVVTFDNLYKSDDNISIDTILKNKFVLLTDTMDAKIWNGDWKIYSNATIIGNTLPKPNFKLGLGPVYITNYDGQKIRIATKEDESKFDFKFSVAPIRIQNAMKAWFKVIEWDPAFNKMTIDYCFDKSLITI